MNLSDLRPSVGSSVDELSELVNSNGWSSTLPEKLPERLLLALAKDARTVECDRIDLHSRQKAMASVLYAMVNLLASESGHAKTDHGLKLTEEEMRGSLWIYRVGLDIEISSRIVGLPSPMSVGFLDLLRAQVPGWR